ncbi:hypothetical protein SAY86_013299 [Trapa natans]|uniref:Uncharacterized protein n=1 Tax=Trapa natans TaxID=22666 RepID=A0AAN7RBH5_TRANT|nr:hypothetical protein SAY86_013299 [Trapa natans]
MGGLMLLLRPDLVFISIRAFIDLVGQNLLAQALANAVGLLNVFYGPYGTGKASSAGIFAKALNLPDLKHCGDCNSCVAHNSGKNRRLIEVSVINHLLVHGSFPGLLQGSVPVAGYP